VCVFVCVYCLYREEVAVGVACALEMLNFVFFQAALIVFFAAASSLQAPPLSYK
jgi:hypothetical protein